MIKIIDRYLLKYFLISLILMTLAIGALIVIINMVEQLRDFIDHNVPLSEIFIYYFYFSGWILKSFLPVFVLLAALTSIGILARRNEILAMKASGLSLYRIAMPFLIFTFLLSLAHIYYNEEIFPEGNKRRIEIKEYNIKKRSDRTKKLIGPIQMQVNKSLFFTIKSYHIDRKIGNDVKIYQADKSRLAELISAKEIRFTEKNWMLYDGMKRVFTDSGGSFTTFDSLNAAFITYKPADFEVPTGNPEDLGYLELQQRINLKKQGGEPFTHELVDLKLKLSYPFSSFIVILICVPIASNPKRGGVAVSFAVGAGIALVYFVAFKITQSFGYNEKLHPDLAAWLINGIFLLIGMVIMARSRK
nr:LptF/LptG family permease [candidate division Zixibacteria bacterium]